jgi:hypothetical protein
VGGSLANRDHVEEGEGSDSVWRPTRVPSKVLGVVGRKVTATGADERGGSSCHREVKGGLREPHPRFGERFRKDGRDEQ